MSQNIKRNVHCGSIAAKSRCPRHVRFPADSDRHSGGDRTSHLGQERRFALQKQRAFSPIMSNASAQAPPEVPLIPADLAACGTWGRSMRDNRHPFGRCARKFPSIR